MSETKQLLTPDTIRLGYEVGTLREVSVPFNHIFGAGISGSGKSVLFRTLINKAEEANYRIVIIDAKDPPDYAPYFPKTPIYVAQQSDPLLIKRLLEAKSKLWLRREFASIIELTKGGGSWENILSRAKEIVKTGKWGAKRKLHPIDRKDLIVIIELLDNLIREMSELKLADKPDLSKPVQVMQLTNLSDGLKQLVVRSLAEWILNKEQDIILLVDEFKEQAPRNGRSASADALVRYIEQGRAKRRWLWASNQTITGVDEEVRKQFRIWILGQQGELNEAKRVVDQLPGDIKITPKEVYDIKVGHFIVSNRIMGWSRMTYVAPAGVPNTVARLVASGKFTVTEDGKILEVEPYMDKPRNPILDLETDLQQRYDDLNKKYETLKTEVEELKRSTPTLVGERPQTSGEARLPEPERGVEAEARGADDEPVAESYAPSSQSATVTQSASLSDEPTTLLVKDPIKLISVKDPQEPLRTDTTTLDGQIAQAILEETITPNKGYLAKHVGVILKTNFGFKFGDGLIGEGLRKLVEPPYRLFTAETDKQSRTWFRLRETAKERVEKA